MAIDRLDKAFCYDTLEKLHMLKSRLTYNPVKDLELYCKTFNLVPLAGALNTFTTMLGLSMDLHVYEIDRDAHKMVLSTLLDGLPKTIPELFKHSFLVTTAGNVFGYNCFAFTLLPNNEYLLSIGSSTVGQAMMSLHGRVADMGAPVLFTGTIIDDGSTLPETPETIRKEVLKYLYTFSILLQAEKTPVEIQGYPRTIKNHYAKKYNVSKSLWTTNYVFLNAAIKRFYDEHTPMDKSNKSAVPRITRAHVRNRIINGVERQLFVTSYVSRKWVRDKLTKTMATVL